MNSIMLCYWPLSTPTENNRKSGFLMLSKCIEREQWHEMYFAKSVRMQENADQNNFEYGHYLRSDGL